MSGQMEDSIKERDCGSRQGEGTACTTLQRHEVTHKFGLTEVNKSENGLIGASK